MTLGADETPVVGRQLLAAQLGEVGPFAEMSSVERDSAASQFEQISLSADEVLVAEGATADSMYILLDGRLTVTIRETGAEDRSLAELEPGAVVGEVALLAGGHRSATVRASGPCRLAALSADGFSRLVETHPGVASRIAEMVSRRLRENQLVSQLALLLGVADTAMLDEVCRAVQWCSLSAGETLFAQDDEADCAYLVVSGRLMARVRAQDGSEQVVGEIPRGELVGEYGIILDQPRGATVVAKRDSDLARLPRDVFDELVERFPRLALQLAKTIIGRSGSLSVQTRKRREEHRTIAIVALDNDSHSKSFVETIVAKLDGLGGSFELNSKRVDQLLGKPGISQSVEGDPAYIRLVQWLNQLESSHRYLVYHADDEGSRWNDLAIRHADHVIFLADATSDPAPRGLEAKPAELRRASHQGASLVLLHEPGAQRPTGTARWLADRELDAVYHVRLGNDADLSRIARTLGGRALGLVLGGGGARGFAHLGVLRALEELGIAVDMIGGTSIGAPVAVPTAQGASAAEGLAAVSARFRSLLDYTLPLTSLIAGRRISNNIEAHTGGWDIEDLWIPYYCVSTDITAACQVHHHRGNLARAVRASVSIPGVLPPVPEGDHLLVDGGVMNNLPIDVMRKINATGPVIAIDVVPHRGPTAKSDYGLAVSGWQVAAKWFSRKSRALQAPALGGTILRSMLVGADQERAHQLDANLADLYVSVNVAKVGILEFERVEEVEAIGYEQAYPVIKQWLEQGGNEFSDSLPGSR